MSPVGEPNPDNIGVQLELLRQADYGARLRLAVLLIGPGG